ncbi:hypothetical protein FZI85_03465 [Mycobacterium sp. CBMA293]|uniref:hypothetical protein n=1 Tax=unclassified Mycolicibacterium TaxID=2636767 RepID=UPI0012DF727D|nr:MULTISPECIES: hypothetical protein [unclassified Mycolicibacterium]MUL46994.1 hypothetical protein [Mycolicibacterium sp. CBMA 360]MUL58370.1 hypothetical protein [Mycolicibacterium sp. CBMA 335]MUL73828.1 hypothetical protein [Mycolicibacterium sp. CBMA 311]MUL93253.1 hypothetical protein [Mycolicibacterium sp. CBMA 230]MUM07800.1 hypothetical protein [Mycolicibacterium sp. CBMA 213]
MPGPLFVVGAVAMCPHGGQITTISSDTRVLAGGMPVALMTDQFMVAGCAFVVGTVPQPCLKVQWTTPTALTLINGQPAITQASVGLCIAANGAPNGPPIIVSTQTMAVAS